MKLSGERKMRNNNIYWKDYHNYLERENITVEDEYNDILNLIEGKGGFYEEYKARLIRWWENKDADYIKEGKGKIKPDEELNTVICMPINYMDKVAPREVHLGMKPAKTAEQIEELKLLHWLYLEMETIRERRQSGRS